MLGSSSSRWNIKDGVKKGFSRFGVDAGDDSLDADEKYSFARVLTCSALISPATLTTILSPV